MRIRICINKQKSEFKNIYHEKKRLLRLLKFLNELKPYLYFIEIKNKRKKNKSNQL